MLFGEVSWYSDIKDNSAMVKKITKEKKVIEDKVEVSIVEAARNESKEWKRGGANGSAKRILLRDLYFMWLSIPDTFRNMPDGVQDKMGIEDATILELMQYKTQKAFAQEFGVNEKYLTEWKHEWAEKGEFAATKTFFRKLTKNMIGAMYRKALIEGDAARAMAWMKIVEDWTEQFGVRHSGKVEYSLDEEERAELDRVLKLNGKGI